MVDIIDVTETDHLHIRRWQARLAEHLATVDEPPRLELWVIWETLASLIGLHMRAEDEICGPAIYGTGSQGLEIAQAARAAHEDIREVIGEASLQPMGTPQWWHLTRAALSAWTRHHDYEQHGSLAERRRNADPALRARLAGQWRAFREAYIRDQSYPDAPPELPTCQLRLSRPAPPRPADPAFSPMGCTCPACTETLARAFGSDDGRPTLRSAD